VALQLNEDEPSCPQCGNVLAESTDFEKRHDWQVQTVTCHACRVKHAATEDHRPGEYVVVTRRDADG
jgi:hypothetical protein